MLIGFQSLRDGIICNPATHLDLISKLLGLPKKHRHFSSKENHSLIYSSNTSTLVLGASKFSHQINKSACFLVFLTSILSKDISLPHHRSISQTSTSVLSSLPFGQIENFHKFSLPLFYQLYFLN